MKKVKLKNDWGETIGKKGDVLFYSEIKRSYGYDILTEKYNYAFGFGASLKNKFEDNIIVQEITLKEKSILFLKQINLIKNGLINILKYKF